MRAHGKVSTYNHGCHCVDCTAANTRYGRTYRADNRDTINAGQRARRAAKRKAQTVGGAA